MHRQFKGLGQQLAHNIRRLGGTPDRQFTSRAPVGGSLMGFDRHVLHLRHVVVTLDNQVCFGKAFLHIALAQFKVVANICARNRVKNRHPFVGFQIVVDQRRTGFHTLAGIKNPWQLFVFNLNQLNSFKGSPFTGSSYNGYRFTNKTYFINSNKVPVNQIEADLVGVILTGHNCFYARMSLGFTDIKLFNFAMRHSAFFHLDINKRAKKTVVDKLGCAGYFVNSIFAQS